MVSKERKISSKPTTAAKDSHAQFRGFQTLISAIQSSEGLKPPVLKSWYCILVNLSLKESIGCSDNKDSPNCSDTGLKMEPKDRSLVAERLFEELGNRFETLFSALCDVSANRENGHAILGSDVWANVDELTLLLRCCMVILTLVDEALVLEKFQVLLLILGKLKSFVTSGGNEKRPVTFKKFISREFSFGDATSATALSEDFVASRSILEPSEPYRPFLCAILEALVDQKLSQKKVSKIKKIQTMCLRSESLPRFPLRPEDKIGETSQNASILKCTRESTFGVEEETEESYNGKVYLQYLTKDPSKEPDYDVLADFVECKPGKDYCRWLKDKERYRKWKSKKMAVVRWKKRRMTWKLMVQNKA